VTHPARCSHPLALLQSIWAPPETYLDALCTAAFVRHTNTSLIFETHWITTHWKPTTAASNSTSRLTARYRGTSLIRNSPPVGPYSIKLYVENHCQVLPPPSSASFDRAREARDNRLRALRERCRLGSSLNSFICSLYCSVCRTHPTLRQTLRRHSLPGTPTP